MSEEEVLENLKIIKFDSKVHSDVKDAMRELVKSEKYVDVLVGKNTDSNLVEDVQRILESYEKLKDIPQEEIMEIISTKEEVKDETNDEDEIDDQFIFEVVINRDDKGIYHIMRKNPETNEYEEINKLAGVAFNDEKHYFIDDERKNLYNLLGDVIFCSENLLSSIKIIDYYDNFYRLDDFDKTILVSFDGKVIYNLDETLYSKNIALLFDRGLNSIKKNENYDLEYHNIVDMLKYRKKYEFLNTWKIDEIFENYMLLSNKNDQAYYRFDGSLVLDTINNDYVTLGRIYSSDNIITVSRYDGNLINNYGYYSLDRGYEIEPTRNKKIYPWYQSGLCGTKSFTYIIKDNGGFKSVKRKKHDFHIYGKNKYDSINKISDNAYQVYDCLYFKENGEWNFVSLSMYHIDYYDKFDFLVGNPYGLCLEDDYYLEKEGLPNVKYALEPKKSSNEGYCWFDLKLSNLMVQIMKNYSKPKLTTSKNSTLTLEKSSFVPSIGMKTNSMLLENSKELAILEDKDVDTALKVLIDSGVITERQAQSLILKDDKKQEIQVARKDEIIGEDFYDSKGYYHFADITKILGFSEDGSIVWVKAKSSGIASKKESENAKIFDVILDRKTQKVVSNPDYRVVNLDASGNFIVERKENASSRMYLLNSRRGTLISSKIEIQSPKYGIYIAHDENGKYQAYNVDGEEVIKKVDKLDWQDKYFVSEKGRLLKKDSVLKLENFGYVYLLEEDGDKLIRIPQNNLDLLDLLYDDQKTLELKK